MDWPKALQGCGLRMGMAVTLLLSVHARATLYHYNATLLTGENINLSAFKVFDCLYFIPIYFSLMCVCFTSSALGENSAH